MSFTLNHLPAGYFAQLRRQRGIGLLESILGMLVAGFMLIMLTQWMLVADNDLRAKRNADSLQQFTQMAVHYLDVNRDAIVRVTSAASVAAGTAEAGTLCKVGSPVAVTTFSPWAGGAGKATCAVDAKWLIDKKYLPDGFATNPYGQSWVAVYRQVYADYDGDGVGGTPFTTQGDIEVLVVATGGTATPNNELGMTVQLMGGLAGLLPAPVPSTTTSSVAGCNLGQICGPGGWKVNAADFNLSY